MDIGDTLDICERAAWRAWLDANHAKSREIWLVFPNKGSGRPRLPYNDAVEEALCFGWIDSIVKKHSPDASAQRFTPRSPGTPVSETNKERARRMIESGRMTSVGLAALGDLTVNGFEVPADIAAALQADAVTWRNFEAFPEGYKRIRVGW